ncbi:MAG: hypothetical protein V4543_13765 [Bacteroidota bacterium]
MKHASDDKITISVPDDWWISKWDKSEFYRNDVCQMAGGQKAVDILCRPLDEAGKLVMIELKDYRTDYNKLMEDLKPGGRLVSEVPQKLLNTLSGLLLGARSGNNHFTHETTGILNIDRKISFYLLLVYTEQSPKIIGTRSRLNVQSLDSMLENLKQHIRRKLSSKFNIRFTLLIPDQAPAEAWSYTIT